jgi:hypothetical protein
MKLRPGKLKIDIHRTRDAVMVSDAVANGPARTAIFRPGTRAICKCAAGECAPGDCDELWVYDVDNNKIACFYGNQFRATDETGSGGAPSGLCVYRVPSTTGDKAIDDAVLGIQKRLADINKANAEFWAVRE